MKSILCVMHFAGAYDAASENADVFIEEILNVLKRSDKVLLKRILNSSFLPAVLPSP